MSPRQNVLFVFFVAFASSIHWYLLDEGEEMIERTYREQGN